MQPDRFAPPRCPNRRCRHHRDPTPRFCRRHGSYRPRCRTGPVPRFLCKGCGRSFSRQTFRIDYRDRRPDCNVPLLRYLTSGVGLRQAGRNLDLSVHAVQRKFRKLARQLRLLNRNLLTRLPGRRTFLFDEIESYEQRAINPVTVPVLIDQDSMLVVDVRTAPIRRVARRGSRAHRRLQRHEQHHGRRRDLGRRCVERSLGRFQRLLDGQPAVLVTDQKALYASVCRRRFGPQCEHHRFPGRAPRTVFNPLFRINLTDAMLRDNNGRLRRRTWLVSKTAWCLALQLAVFQAYRNWHRPRTNGDDPGLTPGVRLGLVRRRLSMAELLGWRQDWRQRSIHPASASADCTVSERAA